MPSQIEQYRQRKLSAAELQAIDEHIGACEACRELLNESLANLAQLEESLLANWPDMLASVGADTKHLSYEQVAAYVEQKVEHQTLEHIKRHLGECAECDERVENLRAFREEAETPSLATKTELPAKPRQTLASFWESLSSAQLVPAAALAVLLVLGVVWMMWRSQDAPAQFQRLALNDGGGRVVLDEQGKIVAPTQIPPRYEEMIRTALVERRTPTPSTLATLFGVAGRLRGASEASVPFQLVSPLGTVVPTDRPTLRWQPLENRSSYTVTVSDRGKEVATSPPLENTEWTVPESLPRDVIYAWQVTAARGGEKISSPIPPAPAARFKVLEATKAQELEFAAQKYAGMHLLLGSLYAEAGLLDDAEREFQALTNANPKSSIAVELLENLRAVRTGNPK